MSRTSAYLLDLFFPNRCVLCGNVIKWDIPYCDKCFEELPYTDDEFCNGCGNTVNSCVCRKEKMWFSRCYAAFYYEDTAKSAVIYLKNTKNDIFPRLAAEKIYEDMRLDNYKFKADCIVPVPMTRWKHSVRGYNQAAVIGKALSELMNIPVYENALRRKTTVVAQHMLSMNERKESASRSYYPGNTENIKGKCVILCDDVMTTGSTVKSCAKVLIESGAEKVIVVSATTTVK